MDYLNQNRNDLTTRYEYKKDMCEWYQWSTVREVKLFDLEKKIICPYKSESPNFALMNEQNTYFSKDIYQLIKLKDIKEEYEYFLGLLNSKVIKYFFSNYGKKMGSITEFYAEAMLDIPLKRLDLTINAEKKAHDKIVDYVREIILLNKKLKEIGDKTTSETKDLNDKINSLDKEINEEVYKLYGITDKEREIIENS